MSESEALSASLEDYLEAIFHVVADKGAARAKDISKRLKVNSSSVTGALHVLSEKELINYAPYDVITLTGTGKKVAKDVIRRHEVLRDFFVKILGVEDVAAEEGACKMEHAVPRPIVEKLVRYMDFLEACPRGGTEWVKGFEHYCDTNCVHEDCEQCTTQCLEDIKNRREQGSRSGAAVTLMHLKPGQRAKILEIQDTGFHSRVADLGVAPGTMIEVERDDVEGDGLDVKVKGYHLSLRKEEADRISVELKN